VYLWVVLVPFRNGFNYRDQVSVVGLGPLINIIKDNFWPSFGIYVVPIIYAIEWQYYRGRYECIQRALSLISTRNFGQAFGIATSVLNIFHLYFSLFG